MTSCYAACSRKSRCTRTRSVRMVKSTVQWRTYADDADDAVYGNEPVKNIEYFSFESPAELFFFKSFSKYLEVSAHLVF